MKILLTLAVIALFASCAVVTPRQRCTPSKGSRDYAAGEQVKTTLVAVHRTMKGYKHFFVTETKDTFIQFHNYRFNVDSCYTLTL